MVVVEVEEGMKMMIGISRRKTTEGLKMMLIGIQTDTHLNRVQKEIAEKEQPTDDMILGLNKQFIIFANKILAPKKQQSVPGQDTGES